MVSKRAELRGKRMQAFGTFLVYALMMFFMIVGIGLTPPISMGVSITVAAGALLVTFAVGEAARRIVESVKAGGG